MKTKLTAVTKFEKGKANLSASEETISLQNSYITPVIKITSTEDIVINLKDITSTSFKVEKSSDQNIVIHYVVIESSN